MEQVMILQFPRGNQGELVERGLATNKITKKKYFEGHMSMCSQNPMRYVVRRTITTDGRVWPVMVCQDGTLELRLSSAWKVTFRKGKVTIKIRDKGIRSWERKEN